MKKSVDLTESTAQDLLYVQSRRRALRRAWKSGQLDDRTLRLIGRTMSQEAKALYRELLEAEALALQDRIIHLGHHAKPDEPRLLQVALDAARDAQDRVSGKAVERQLVSGRHTIIFAGLDPTKLPDKDARHGAPRLPSPATRRTWSQANQDALRGSSEGSSNVGSTEKAVTGPRSDSPEAVDD